MPTHGLGVNTSNRLAGQPSTNDLRSSNVILFDTSKRELFSPTSGFKTLTRKLRSSWRIAVQKDELQLEKLNAARILVFGGPREKFTSAEFEALRQYIGAGGSVLIMLGEGGEQTSGTNINFLLEECGININSDEVIRTVYYKYPHPKEAYISNGILNREINRRAGKKVSADRSVEAETAGNVHFVYPYGATLTLQKPAVAVLSTGSACFPLNRPVCAFYALKKAQGKEGRMAVIGSSHIFHDSFIDKDENSKILDVVLDWLTNMDFKLNSIDAEDPEISDYRQLPDTDKLSERPRVCLQESEEVPKDFTQLFQTELNSLHVSNVATVLKAKEDLRVKHEPLTLIQPTFETPLPPVQLAVFPPTFRELPPPSLELFDLDEAFSTEKVRMAQLTNDCTDEELEYFITSCGEVLGVNAKLAKDNRDARHVLEYILAQTVEFKKRNQDAADTLGAGSM
eukprot:scpid44524/ scgid11845/ Intraflagellar transport protein 52 homolog; Protein NGD5